MKKLLDMSEGAIKELISTLNQDLKGVIKLTKDNVINTLKGSGHVDMNLNPSQVKRLNQAHVTGRGMKMTLTKAQSDRLKSGGFLAGLLPAAAGLARGLAPALGTAALTGTAGFGVNKLLGKIFGKGMKPIKHASGLYLAPYRSGAGMVGGKSGDKIIIKDKRGGEVVVGAGFLGNLLGKLIPF